MRILSKLAIPFFIASIAYAEDGLVHTSADAHYSQLPPLDNRSTWQTIADKERNTADLPKLPKEATNAISLEPLRQVMNERLSLMIDVARYKWNAKAPIEDLPREKQIIDGLKVQAQELGVPAVWAERFFRAQIEAAKVIQREQFAEWERSGAGRFEHAADLATQIRPKLDALTLRLLRELAAAWPTLADPAQRERIAAAMHEMPGAGSHRMAASIAIAPLVDGSASASAIDGTK